jgi:TfoX/Sxy family transcriptional regulator of competence genes
MPACSEVCQFLGRVSLAKLHGEGSLYGDVFMPALWSDGILTVGRSSAVETPPLQLRGTLLFYGNRLGRRWNPPKGNQTD